MYKKVFFVCLLFFQSIYTVGVKSPSVAIFDLGQSSDYCVTAEAFRSNGFLVRYYPLGEVLDFRVRDLCKYDCCFFILTPDMLVKMNKSPVSRKVALMIRLFLSSPNKTTCLFLPPSCLRYSFGLFGDMDNIFLRNASIFLKSPLELRKKMYHTTLFLPSSHGIKLEYGSNFNSVVSQAFLPIRRDDCEEINNLLPLGIYWFDKRRNSNVIISGSSVLSCAGIAENCKVCPINGFLRNKLKAAISGFVDEICSLVSQDKGVAGLDIKRIRGLSAKKFSLPKSTNFGKKFSVAWMELKTGKAELCNMVKFIFDSKLDYLWLTLNPNMYYSRIAKNWSTKKQFLKNLSLFTSALRMEAIKRGVRPPSILVGFEIVNNFDKKVLPKKFARDVYGNEYHDVPSPLSVSFWRNEIKVPLEKFLRDWHRVANGIEIGGVMLDLEMYCRKTASAFLPSMGFSPDAISGFMKKKYFEYIPINTFSEYLIYNRLGKKYFRYLEYCSERIGRHLHRFFKKNLPNGIISCYAPNVSTDWFYKGFYRGLSSKKSPLHLFTFNSEINEHRGWLEENGIYIKHASVLMLSKLGEEKDFSWYDKIIKRHDGIWFNRFSRFTEKFHDDWSAIEQTRMNFIDRERFFKYLNSVCSVR